MKFLPFLFSLMMFTPVATIAGSEHTYQEGYSTTKTCYRSEYREEYVPGDEDEPGYVKSWKETIEFPCDNNKATITKPTRTVVEEYREVDDNDCSEGTVAGGLLGGGIAAAISRGNGRWWAVPTGIVTGAMIGCDIDGG